MKRFATAAVAATTALSLAVVPAGAADTSSNDDEVTSSVGLLALLQAGKLAGAENQADYDQAAVETLFGAAALQSSFENDEKKGWPMGRTFDIIWGSLLGVAALGGLAFLALNAK